MPNWCDTTYILTGDSKNLQIIKNLIDLQRHEDELLTSLWTYCHNNFSEKKFPIEAINNHDMNYKMWGTKWDISSYSVNYDYDENNIINRITISGATAWGVHDEFWKHVNPYLNIQTEIIGLEPGNDFFVRMKIDKNGEIIDSEEACYISLESLSYFGNEYFVHEIIEYYLDSIIDIINNNKLESIFLAKNNPEHLYSKFINVVLKRDITKLFNFIINLYPEDVIDLIHLENFSDIKSVLKNHYKKVVLSNF